MKTQRKRSFLTVFGVLTFLAVSLVCSAQPADGPGDPGAGGPDGGRQQGGRGGWGRRRMDPEQMRKMMNERMKQMLGASDEEWQALGPLVDDVMNAQRDLRNGFMMRRRPGNNDGESSFPESDALKTALEDENTDNEVIKAKLEAYRAARKKKEAVLEAAQEKLRSVLTIRQEAQLVLMGTLD